MIARLLLVATLLCSLGPSLCAADVLLSCTETGSTTCVLGGLGVEHDISFWLRSNPGLDLAVGAVGFSFDEFSDAWGVLNPTAFSWVPQVMFDPGTWFSTTDLPNPEAAAFFAAAAVPIPDGVSVEIARLTVNPQSPTGVLPPLSTGLVVFDEDVVPLTVKGGETLTFLVPEPGCMSLLIIGTVMIARRRRY